MSTVSRSLQSSVGSPCAADSTKYSPSTRLPIRRPCMSVNATMTVSILPASTSAASCSFVSKTSLLGLSAPAPSPRHEAFEQRARPWQVGGELLWMALHRNDKAVVRLDAFHGPVLAVGGLLQPFGQVLDRLVMQAVDPDLVLAGRPTQLGRWVDLNRVREVAAHEGAHLVTFQMLDQRAAHRHVDHLLTPADAQHRQLTLTRLTEHRQLGFVELGVGIADLLVPPLSIKGRIDVPASRQQEPIDVRERLGPGEQVHGLGARGRDRPAVGPEVLQAPPRVDRDPDLRALVKRRPPQARPRSSRALQLNLAPLDL